MSIGGVLISLSNVTAEQLSESTIAVVLHSAFECALQWLVFSIPLVSAMLTSSSLLLQAQGQRLVLLPQV